MIRKRLHSILCAALCSALLVVPSAYAAKKDLKAAMELFKNGKTDKAAEAFLKIAPQLKASESARNMVLICSRMTNKALNQQLIGTILYFKANPKIVLPTLLQLTKSGDAGLRRCALKAIGRLGPKANSTKLDVAKLMKDKDAKVRKQAIATLSLIDNGPKGKPIVDEPARADTKKAAPTAAPSRKLKYQTTSAGWTIKWGESRGLATNGKGQEVSLYDLSIKAGCQGSVKGRVISVVGSYVSVFTSVKQTCGKKTSVDKSFDTINLRRPETDMLLRYVFPRKAVLAALKASPFLKKHMADKTKDATKIPDFIDNIDSKCFELDQDDLGSFGIHSFDGTHVKVHVGIQFQCKEKKGKFHQFPLLITPKKRMIKSLKAANKQGNLMKHRWK